MHETRPSRWAIWSRALRLQQWPKNLLLFLPALLAHQLGNTELLKNLIVAFFAFSASASAVYLFNDLLDLPSDRKHPSKRHRPLAAGWISALHALIAAPLLILLSLSIAWWLVSPPFAAVLLIYLIITSFYSLWLKKLFAIDLVILSFLYLWRIFAGAVVATTPLSFWLVAFALCFFLSLALIKRVSDLQKMERLQRHSLDRRDYILDDLPVLRAVGVATAVQALTFLILYLQSDSVQQLYRSPLFFWFAIAALAIWLIRIWLITGRNEMDDDPVQFVLKDRWSGVMVLVIAVSALMAKLLELPHWVALYWR